MSGLPDDLVEALRAALKGESIPASEGIASPEKAISIHDVRQHGHVAAIHCALKKSGLGGMIAPKRSSERDVVAAMDWLLERQCEIQRKLAKKHLANGDPVKRSESAKKSPARGSK